MREVWKKYDRIEYDGELWFSSFGRVKRTSYIGFLGKHDAYKTIYTDRVVTPSSNGNGYKYVTVSSKGKKKHIYVHRAVAELFLPKVEGQTEVNHIDYDRGNNNVINLEWCTRSENVQHSVEHIRHPRPSVWSTPWGAGIRLKKGKFEVSVSYAGKQHYAGRYDSIEEAQSARRNKLIELGIGEYDRIYYQNK